MRLVHIEREAIGLACVVHTEHGPFGCRTTHKILLGHSARNRLLANEPGTVEDHKIARAAFGTPHANSKRYGADGARRYLYVERCRERQRCGQQVNRGMRTGQRRDLDGFSRDPNLTCLGCWTSL